MGTTDPRPRFVTGAPRHLPPAPRWIADELLGGRPTHAGGPPAVTIREARADDARDPGVTAYRALRRAVFCVEQGLFPDRPTADLDDHDADGRVVVLLAHDADETLLGGVRLGPARAAHPDIGWWTGSRLVVAPAARRRAGVRVGAALVRAACARAEAAGVLRFDADVQAAGAVLFERLGWTRVRDSVVAGAPHVTMRWPVTRVQDLVVATKAPLGALLGGLGPAGFVGDDGAPVPGSDLIACCDAIVPAMVERDPEWAGWAGVLVNVNDLAAMGATPVGLLDAVGARDASFAHRVLSGVRDAATAYGVPLLGGHTQLDVPASLSLTALGRTDRPVPAGGGRAGHRVRLTTDLGGGWRPGYAGRQWDSTTSPRPSAPSAPTHRTARPPRRTCRWPGSPGPSACSPRPPGSAPCSTSPLSPAPTVPPPATGSPASPGSVCSPPTIPAPPPPTPVPRSPPSAASSSPVPGSGCAGRTARRPRPSPRVSPAWAAPAPPPPTLRRPDDAHDLRRRRAGLRP